MFRRIPILPNEVGGETDILIGIKYLQYRPQEVWKSKAGLAVLDSCFLSVDGTTGVVGSPHVVFTEVDLQYYSTQIVNDNVEAQSNLVTTQSYYASNVYRYRNAYFINKEMLLLGDKSHDIIGIDPICGTEQKTVSGEF